MQMEKVRLNKYLAQCGICSRREADGLIAAGRVEVNGRMADMGVKVSAEDAVAVDGKLLKGRDDKVVLAYYKPQGVVCTERDSHADRIVTQEIGYPVRVTYAGRLDKDSEGLLLLSNDGDLIQRMMKGANGHEKEYVVRVKQELTDSFLKRLAAGIWLPELGVTTRPCRVRQSGKYTFHIILTQGLNRQIRRMCQALSVDVVSLKRVRVINITLDGLRPGEYRLIEGEERDALYEASRKQVRAEGLESGE